MPVLSGPRTGDRPISAGRLVALLAALLTLAGLCVAAGGLWAWQARRHQFPLREEGFHALPRGQAPFLRGLYDFAVNQSLQDGTAQLFYFNTFVFDAQDDPAAGQRLSRLAARVLLPEENWVDLVVRHSEAGHLAFRVSRAPLMPSGWYLFEGVRCVRQWPVDTERFAPPGTHPDPRRRTNLKGYSFVYSNRSRPVLAEEFHSQWVEVAVGMEDHVFRAEVNGEVLDTLDLTAQAPSFEWLAAGAAGVRAGDLPPVEIDWMRLEGMRGAGQPLLVEATFDLPQLGLGEWWALAWPRIWPLLIEAAAAVLLLGVLVPGVGLLRVVVWVAAGHLLLALSTLWVEHRRFINVFGPRPESWWTAQLVGLGLFFLLMILRHREAFRARLAGAEAAPLGRRQWWLWIASLASAAAVLGAAWAALIPPPPGPTELRALPAGEPLRWEPETAPVFRRQVPYAKAALRLDGRWAFTLESGDAVLELYFNLWFLPPQHVAQWLALRLTPTGVGFVPSVGVEPALASAEIAVGRPHVVEVTLDRGRIRAVVHAGGPAGPVVAEAERASPWTEAGSCGVVGRAGAGVVQPLGLVASFAPRRAIEEQTFTAWAAAHPRWLLAAVGALSAVLGLGLGLLTAAVGRAPARAALDWGCTVALLAAAAGLVLWLLQNVGGLTVASWSAAVVLLGPALVATVLWHLFWIANFERLRRGHLASLALFLALTVLVEMTLRASPTRTRLEIQTKPGYIRREFLFIETGGPYIWPYYTGKVTFFGEKAPLRPAPGERRVFCVGGSSTMGAGVESLSQSYPKCLEATLRARTGDAGWRVFNAGIVSYTVLEDLMLWRREIRMRRPEFLVLYIGGNDNLSSEPLTVTWREVQAMLDRLNEPSLSGALYRALFDVRLIVGLRQLWAAVEADPAARWVPQVPVEDFEALLRELLREAEAQGTTVILAPEVLVECLTMEDHALRPYHAVMRRLAAEFGVPLVETVRAFRARRFDLLMADYIHLNYPGNQWLADLVADVILNKS